MLQDCPRCGTTLEDSKHFRTGKEGCPLEPLVMRTILGVLMIICAIVVIGTVFKGLLLLWENVGIFTMLLVLIAFYFLCRLGYKVGKLLDL